MYETTPLYEKARSLAWTWFLHTGHGAIVSAGGFAVFPDEHTGHLASFALLRSASYAGLTVNQALARRSPKRENETETVQRLVNRLGGFHGYEVLRNLDDQRLNALVRVIQRVEGWHAGQVIKIPR